MKLAKPNVPSDDARYRIEQEIYLTHCQNIANIVAAGKKEKDISTLIDLYLAAVNTETEE